MGVSRFGGRVRGAQPVSTWLRGGGTGIARIQRGTISIAAGATSNTATLTNAVDTTRTRLVYVGMVGANDATVDAAACRLALTDSVTVTASVNSVSGAGSRVVGYEVVEYAPGVIRAIRRGTITVTGSTAGTDTITAVNVDKSTLDYLGFTTDGASTAPATAIVRVDLTNATTVTANGLGSVNRTVGYQVIEWN